MPFSYAVGLVWLRRDLRVADNAALHHALRSCGQVHCAFLLDTEILDPLPRRDRRVDFILDSVRAVDAGLRALGGGGLLAVHGRATQEIPRLATALGVQAVFASHDDEAPAAARDQGVRDALARTGIAFHTSKDHVVFERREVLTQAGTPYSVFTPYKRAWLAKLDAFYLSGYPVERHAGRLAPRPPAFATREIPSVEALGFAPSNLAVMGFPGGSAAGRRLLQRFLDRIDRYGEDRDFPAIKGTSFLSAHLRFGTVSIRELAREAHARSQAGSAGAATWLSELVWRDFYVQVLANFPHVNDPVAQPSFRPEYERIEWEQGPQAQRLFEAWCEGRTGYPLVDAAMAQINQTGFMHNRLRMVTASFLCKDLGVDWRWGERYFARQLNDYDFSANNGGWQWASSSGCDAQPWFRIFNPVTQSGKFDARGEFIRRYVPQLAKLPDALIHAPWEARPADLETAGVRLGVDYPLPIVDHAQAREKTLARYAVVKGKA